MTDVPEAIDDYPAAIEAAQIQLEKITRRLEKQRRQKRNMKINFKTQARDSDASNRTERKAFVKNKKAESSLYQETLETIEQLSLQQARAKGRLRRLRAELNVWLESTSDLPDGTTLPA